MYIAFKLWKKTRKIYVTVLFIYNLHANVATILNAATKHS